MIEYPTIMGTTQGFYLDSLLFSHYCKDLKQSGFNHIRFQFQIEDNCDISCGTNELVMSSDNENNKIVYLPRKALIISEGMYLYSSRIPPLMLSLLNKDSTLNTLSAQILHWDSLLKESTNQLNNNRVKQLIRTKLKKNFQVFRKTFPNISIIDIELNDNIEDSEDKYDLLIDFIIMLNSLDYGISFSVNADTNNGETITPQEFAKLFAKLIQTVFEKINESQKPQPNLDVIYGLNPFLVKSLNIVYDMGSINSWDGIRPKIWADEIKTRIDKLPPSSFNRFTTDKFIIPGFFTDPNEDSPEIVKEKINDFSKDPCIGGGFVSTIDTMLEKPEMLHEYANALCTGLNQITLNLKSSVAHSKITFVPVNGVLQYADYGQPFTNNNYAFCSPIFTLKITNNDGSLAAPTLPLQLDKASGKFKIFPQTTEGLDQNPRWTTLDLPANEFKFSDKFTIRISYVSDKELSIALSLK